MDACIFCGCRDDEACPERCAWSDLSLPGAPICSSCETMAGELGRLALELATLTAPAATDCTPNPGRPEAVGRGLLVWLCAEKSGPGVTLDRWRQTTDDPINEGRKAYRKLQRASARKLSRPRRGSRSVD